MDFLENLNLRNVHIFQLIQCKVDLNAINEHGNTALHYACFWGYDDLAEELIHAGALISIANKYGDTPIEKCRPNVGKRIYGSLFLVLIVSILISFFFRNCRQRRSRYSK